ncbi:MAG: hypothetical protein ING44_19075 [Telmatospirillum sp.]|nr:hypothetical protein [Telmatospirillum sp.]
MTFLSKSRISLIGFCFLALGGCTEQGPDRAVWQATKDAANAVGSVFVDDKPKPASVDAPDPGDTPYPNLAVVPRRPARPDAQTLQSEQAALVGQRQASQNFDTQLRAIDPVLNPTSRPPEPPAIAAALAPVGAPPVGPASAPPTPVASAPIAVPPVAASAPQAASLPPFVPPVLAPATVPAAAPVPTPAVPRPAAPPAAARATPNTAWLVGEVTFADGSPLLSADARATLRAAVVAANEQGGAVRVSPVAGGLAGPNDAALAPRRMAAVAGELESLGLDRDKIRIDAGSFRNARVAVEF